jgi:hypothetical protein
VVRRRFSELLAAASHVPHDPAEKEIDGKCAANKRQEIADIVHQFPLYSSRVKIQVNYSFEKYFD